MLEHLHADLRDHFDRMEGRGQGPRRRLSLHWEDQVFPILRLWKEGCSLTARPMRGLRGLVEIHDGPRPLMTCLIVAAEIEGDQLICQFKRATPIHDQPPVDYVRADSDLALRLPFQ